jgi:hypothetical protein
MLKLIQGGTGIDTCVMFNHEVYQILSMEYRTLSNRYSTQLQVPWRYVIFMIQPCGYGVLYVDDSYMI